MKVMYRISYSDEAKKALRNLPGRYRQRVRRLIESLADEPRPASAKELRGLPNVFRIWINGWRLIYQVQNEEERILIIGIRRKRGPKTYQNLPIE